MKKSIDKLLGGFLIILMIIMTLDVLWGVFTRYVLGAQSSWTEELARYLLIWIGILGAAYASGQNMHLAIDIFPQKLEGVNAFRLKLIINITIILFAVTVLLIGGGRLVYITNKLGQTSAALQISLALVYSILPLSGLVVIFYKVEELFALWKS